MKIIKYDDRGREIGSKQEHIPEIEGAKKKEKEIPELNVVQPMTRKRAIRGLIVGLILGIPVGIFIELLRLLVTKTWEGFFWGIIAFFTTVIISTAVGYIHGSMTDRE